MDQKTSGDRESAEAGPSTSPNASGAEDARSASPASQPSPHPVVAPACPFAAIVSSESTGADHDKEEGEPGKVEVQSSSQDAAGLREFYANTNGGLHPVLRHASSNSKNLAALLNDGIVPKVSPSDRASLDADEDFRQLPSPLPEGLLTRRPPPPPVSPPQNFLGGPKVPKLGDEPARESPKLSSPYSPYSHLGSSPNVMGNGNHAASMASLMSNLSCPVSGVGGAVSGTYTRSRRNSLTRVDSPMAGSPMGASPMGTRTQGDQSQQVRQLRGSSSFLGRTGPEASHNESSRRGSLVDLSIPHAPSEHGTERKKSVMSAIPRTGSGPSLSNTGEDMTRSSTRLRPKVKQSRRRRVQKDNAFSEWELSTYTPLITESWKEANDRKGETEIGLIFYDCLLRENPDLKSMFTAERDVQAAKFAGMLGVIAEAVTLGGEEIKQMLRRLAPMHVKKGVSSSHMPRMGKCLEQTLAQILQEKWTQRVQGAWGWLWGWLSKAMDDSLEAALYDKNSVIVRSWDIAMDNFPDHAIGEIFFNTLFQYAPNLRDDYRQTRPILAGKFLEMLSTLVNFHGEKERAEDQLRWLGIRHVAYSAKRSHSEAFCEVLLKTLEQCVGADWTEEMAKEWETHWKEVCAVLFDACDSARDYGPRIEKLWGRVRRENDAAHFGSILRKRLLSGTEWVATLNQKLKDLEPKKSQQQAAGGGPTPTASKRRQSLEGNGNGAPGVVQSGASQVSHESERSDLSSPVSAAPRHAVMNGGGGVVMSSRKRQGSAFGSAIWTKGRRLSVENGEGEEHGEGKNSLRAREGAAMKGTYDAIGDNFWELMEKSVELMWEPERMNEDLICRATEFFRWGMRAWQLPALGEGLLKTLRYFIGKEEWQEEDEKAWHWFWDHIAKTLTSTLKAFEDEHAEVLQRTWALVKQRETQDQLGDRFFRNLTKLGPHVVHLFTRPKKIQAAQFVQVVELLVTFSQNPSEFFANFKDLVIRHIKYGVKAEHTKPFGNAILLGIQAVLDSDWDEKTAQIWQSMWQRVSSCVSRSLNVCSNLLIVALVQGDLQKLKEAIACAPRCQRAQWFTQVNVNGEFISPIEWAIRDGKFNLVAFMINDLLEIRADRDQYYHGRETLFEAHPDIVATLCRECPDLLGVLFDGLLWHSQFVDTETKMVRVNYYVENIYGDPLKHFDAWTSTLGVLVEHRDPKMFLHPVVLKVLEMKWNVFKWYFLGMQAWFLVLLILLITCQIQSDDTKQCFFVPRLILAVAAVFTAVVLLLFLWMQRRRGQVKHYKVLGFAVAVPRWLTTSFNTQRALAVLLIPAAVLIEPCLSSEDQDEMLANTSSLNFFGRAVSALVSLLLWSQAMQVLCFSTRMAALTWNLGVMFEDLNRILIIMIFIILAFATALSSLNELHFESFGEGLVQLTREVVRLSPEEARDMHPFSQILLFSFVTLTNIGMTAILIAQIRVSYQLVADNKAGYAAQHRSSICIDIECLLPIKWRQSMFDVFHFDQPCPLDMNDAGPTGGIQAMEKAGIRQSPRYKPDRVRRYTGEASSMDPWEDQHGLRDDEED